jgi:chaperone required for assembly of F1-ATPase
MNMLGGRRRVWSEASVLDHGTAFGIALDGKPLRTPAQKALRVPSHPFAEAIAAEWAAQGERIAPDTMPLTRLASTAIDRVSEAMEAVCAELAGYGGTDLLCYRAPHPDALIEQQAAHWDPPLRWVEAQHGVTLVRAAGVMHVAQPPAALDRLRRAVDRVAAAHGPLGLTAFHDLVTLSGSVVLGLAVAAEAMAPAEAWGASRVDEAYQAAQWGIDAEAEAAAAVREAAFLRAATVIGWLRKAPA